MGCFAEFGIIDAFQKDKDYFDYEPDKYSCIAIDDDYIDDWWDDLTRLQTYFHCYHRPAAALARWGVTLIPPESLEPFYNIVRADERSQSAKELHDLMALLRRAISENKHVIHYGV